MKLNINHFSEIFEFTIKGDETWLNKIYNFFPCPKESKLPTLSGDISVRKMDADILEVKGKIKYAPYVDCSRCGIKISWPIEDSFSLYYLPEDQQNSDRNVKDLKKSELEEYYFEEDKLDIEQMLNERIQLAIPPRIIVPREDKPEECLVCGENIEESQVYGVKPEDDPTNPFQILKQLKKPN